MTFTPFDTKYSPHTDLTMNPVTGVVTITVAFHPNNRGGYNCKVWEFAPPYTGAPTLKRDWKQGAGGVVGPFGHGASLVLPTGGLLTVVPVGIDSGDNVTPAMQIEDGYSPPYVLGGGSPPAPAGSGGVVLLPSVATNAAWEGHVLTAGVLVDIPSVFGVPSASAYLVRFVAVAPAANVRARAGTQATPFFLTCNTQAPGVEMHEQGWIPGPQAWISPAQGTPTTWLQVIGYST